MRLSRREQIDKESQAHANLAIWTHCDHQHGWQNRHRRIDARDHSTPRVIGLNAQP
jgi:hypothetical protein